MTYAVRLLLLATLLVATSSCGIFSQKTAPEAAEEKKDTRYVGRVASLPQGGKFALLEIFGAKRFQANTILLTYAEGRQANLKLTGENLGRYAAADIQSGTVEVGDGLYTNLAEPPKELPPAMPERQKSRPSLF